MASQPPNKPKASRWGSLLAVVEQGLDTILADTDDASARSRAQDEAAANDKPPAEDPTALVVPSAPSDTSRSPSRSRVNDRLQAKLAKAAANRNPSRSTTPLNQPASPRSSMGSRQSIDIQRPQTEPKDDTTSIPGALDIVPNGSGPADYTTAGPVPDSLASDSAPDLVITEITPTLLTSGLPINPARISSDSQTRPKIEADAEAGSEMTIQKPSEAPAQNSAEKHEVTVAEDASIPDAEHTEVHQEDEQSEKQRLEEYIDKLEAKLGYFAKETAAAAQEAMSSSQLTPHERKLAEKDDLIATLRREGIELSKTEWRQRNAIKERGTAIQKMRAQTQQDEKAMAELRKRLARLEDSESGIKQQLRRTEQVEKQNAEYLRRVSNIEKDLENHKSDLASNKATIAVLRSQLLEAEKSAEKAENSITQADTQKLSAVQEQLEDAKLEKKLAEDVWSAELKRVNEEARQQKQQASFRETELTNEISNYESRLEALRVRAEEASSDVGGDSQAKLLRQIETLQTQYSLAAENWRTIETSLNGRIAAVEKERDEATKREADVRKKARDISSKAKRFEDQIEELTEESQSLTSQLQVSTTEMKKLQSRLQAAEASLSEAKADLDRQKQSFETELSQKLEEERARQLSQGLGIASPSNEAMASRTQSPTSYFRKQSAQDAYGSVQSRRGLSRIPSQEQTPTLSIDRSASRRPSTLTPGLMTSRTPMTPDFPSPSVSRQGSMFSLAQLINGNNGNAPQTPSIHTTNDDADDAFDNRSSPQHTINDVISASTVHTGPSVQLVQHMSSKIQRLEAEKSATKDELARLVAQRDEARDEVVSMMREVDTKRKVDGKTDELESELGQVKQRYEACLEMLGEKEEEVEELKSDLVEVKKMYRELVDRNMK
ncbi:hypothetical protein KCU62_g738, partial [Aureobasidium sp. EXF-3399]